MVKRQASASDTGVSWHSDSDSVIAAVGDSDANSESENPPGYKLLTEVTAHCNHRLRAIRDCRCQSSCSPRPNRRDSGVHTNYISIKTEK